MRRRIALVVLGLLVAMAARAIIVTPGTVFVDATAGQMQMMAYYSVADTAARNVLFASPPTAPTFCWLSGDTVLQVYTGKSGGDHGWFDVP